MSAARTEAANDAGVTLELSLADLAATERLAARLAKLVEPGDVIALEGELGAGKTAFARGFIRALVDAPEVPSPTFTLVQTYDAPRFTIWHFDLYRISKPEEADELGLDEAYDEGVALIEWPERLGDAVPEARLVLRLSLANAPETRHARLIAHGLRAAALLRALRETRA
jgi:tRNA threonylcarbamoyladenosine biosynthesis protein TsaE